MNNESQRNQAGAHDTPRVARPDLRPTLQTEVATSMSGRIWSIEDVAQYLNFPVSAVYKMTAPKASVRIPHIRIGGKLRFRQSDIDRWLTLLTISNLDTLTKVRSAIAKRTHGHDSQAQAP
jgi:excisionase family DNA binding protein